MYVAKPHESVERLVREALLNPHDPLERTDPWFIVEMRCEKCGKLARGPRCHMREAMREHLDSDCPMRHGPQGDKPQMMRVFYPRQ